MPHQRRRQLLLPLLDHPGRALTANTCSHLLEPLPPDSSQPNSPSFSRPVFAHMSHAIILGGDADRVAPSAPGARRPPAGDTAAAPARAGEMARGDRGQIGAQRERHLPSAASGILADHLQCCRLQGTPLPPPTPPPAPPGGNPSF